MLYIMWRQGAGPRYMNVGRKKLITVEAAADWRAEGERKAAQATAA
jgi:hypothetical protein